MEQDEAARGQVVVGVGGSTTSAVSATANGAMRWGAGISVETDLGAQAGAVEVSRAWVNSGDSRPVTVRLDTTSMYAVAALPARGHAGARGRRRRLRRC